MIFIINDALVYLTPIQKAIQIHVDEKIACKAVLLRNQYKLPLADGLLYAKATINNAVFYTQDQHFERITFVNHPFLTIGHQFPIPLLAIVL